MAKVRRFRDRRKPNQMSVYDKSQGRPNSVDQPGTSETRSTPRRAEGGSQDVATEGSISGNVSDPEPTQLPPQPSRYSIQVPGVEELMARVQGGVEPPESHTPALTASLQQSYQTYRPLFRPYLHPVTGLPVTRSANSGSTPVYLLHGIAPIPQPTAIERAGYSGLEDLPILQRMMDNPEINKMHSFYFRFNDKNCPAAVLLVDPLPGMGKSRYAEQERNCRNDGHEAWLYVRKRGDVKWNRDFMAERGGMRQAVYLSRCEEGWRWEQQLGDLLDCRKALNLWIKVKV